MRKIDREITDVYGIESILNDTTVCRIGFVDGGERYTVPVCFGYIDGKILPHSAMSGIKLRCWRKILGAALRLTRVAPSYELGVRVHREFDTKV